MPIAAFAQKGILDERLKKSLSFSILINGFYFFHVKII
jgi:hypothetical protein